VSRDGRRTCTGALHGCHRGLSKGRLRGSDAAGKLEYAQRYGFDSPFWKGRSTATIRRCRTAQINLKDVAHVLSRYCPEDQKGRDYAAAAHWYRNYLSFFPTSGFGRHQLSARRRPVREPAVCDAASEYERPLTTIRATPRSAEAAYAALVSYQKYEETLAAEARPAMHQRATDSG